MSRLTRWVVAAAAALAGSHVHADVWDAADDNDNVINVEGTTDNTLVHGVRQRHDLAGVGPVGDQDWYRVFSDAHSSYEAVVDSPTGRLNLANGSVRRFGPDGATLEQTSTSNDGRRVLRWQMGQTGEIGFIHVSGAACSSSCTAADQYRIAFYETTYTVPRFNNTGGQFTIVTVAATTSASCEFTLLFYADDGTLLGPAVGLLGLSKVTTINTALQPFAAGRSGSIVVTHTCGYGGLSGKAVSIEPATGFAFETPLRPRIL